MPQIQVLAGAAAVDITPPLHVPYLGFDPRQATFEGVHDPLFARAAVFSSDDAHVAILSADALGLSTDLFGPGRDFIAEVRERGSRGTDLPPASILVAATHAHSSPETYGITRIWERGDCAEWIETLADQLAQAIRLAWDDRRPALLSHGHGTAEGVAGNRRMRDEQGRMFSINRKPADATIVDRGPTDDSVTVLLAERDDAGPVVVANFACHPVTMQVQSQVSADFPGVTSRVVEQALGEGSCCLFLQGAAGDINPVRDDSRDWRDVDTYGIMVAGGILHALGRARLSTPAEDPVVAAAHDFIELDSREAPPVREARATLDAAEQAFASVAQDDEQFAALHGAVRRAREMYRLAQFGTDPVRVEMQTLRVGSVGIAGFPGELFCALGLRVKKQSPAAATMVAECANGCLGYLVTQEGWEHGVYEVGPGAWCRIAAGGPDEMTQVAAELLADLFATQDAQPAHG